MSNRPRPAAVGLARHSGYSPPARPSCRYDDLASRPEWRWLCFAKWYRRRKLRAHMVLQSESAAPCSPLSSTVVRQRSPASRSTNTPSSPLRGCKSSCRYRGRSSVSGTAGVEATTSNKGKGSLVIVLVRRLNFHRLTTNQESVRLGPRVQITGRTGVFGLRGRFLLAGLPRLRPCHGRGMRCAKLTTHRRLFGTGRHLR